MKVAIQYPSFGPQHPPRLSAIAAARPTPDSQVVAMEMFAEDSDYGHAAVRDPALDYERFTVMPVASGEGRRMGARLKRAVFDALDRIRPDVLFVNGWGHVESRHSLRWARTTRCPVVVLSDSVYENMPRRWWLEGIKRWLVRGARAGFAAGTPQARYLARLGVPGDAIFFPGSCVVDNDAWGERMRALEGAQARLREELQLPDQFFLSIGRYVEFKNHAGLVRAFARFQQQSGRDDVGLVLCGSGPERDRIERAVSASGARRVTLTNRFAPPDEVARYLALADALVFPSSHFEPWGLVVNEAMACGLPVVVSDQCGCCEDLVDHGGNGYRFDPNSETELAQHLASLAGDAALREQMGRSSLEIIASHSCSVGATMFWRAASAALKPEDASPGT